MLDTSGRTILTLDPDPLAPPPVEEFLSVAAITEHLANTQQFEKCNFHIAHSTHLILQEGH